MADFPPSSHSDNNGEVPETAPVVVLPIPDMPAMGLASQSVSSTSALISPQPLVPSDAALGVSSLADTLEQELAADGRFAAFLPQVLVTVDGDMVHLAGIVPTLPQKQSLLAVVRAVPGVGAVSDALQVK